jgi:Ring finger domain
MASPNVKADRSVKIRRRNTLPGPLHKIRHQSALLQKRHTACGGLTSMSRCGPITTATPATTTTSESARWYHLHQSKTNPYVGWFRHAPSIPSVSSVSFPKSLSDTVVNVDALWLRDWLVNNAHVLHHQHKKRRVAFKGHHFDQCKYQHYGMKSALFQIKQVVENRTDARDLNLDLLLLYKRYSGHLRGGGTDDSEDRNELDDTTIEQYLRRQYASSTESVVVRALSRIACWLLDVPLQQHATPETPSKATGDIDSIQDVGSIFSYDDDDETRSEMSYDNHDTVSGSCFRSSIHNVVDQDNVAMGYGGDENTDRFSVGHGLSSQAEAYYALGAVYRHILAESTPDTCIDGLTRRRADSLDDIDRLDYEITQMDIVRMNRIASRHLDVESIVRLPVLTYQQKNPCTPTIPKERVLPSRTDPRTANVMKPIYRRVEEKEDTELSWMLVPETHDGESINSSMDQYDVDSRCNRLNNSQLLIQQDEVAKDGNDVCVICLESFIPGDRLRVLPCEHSFHVGCIDRWLSGSHSFSDCYTAGCPTCKARPDGLRAADPLAPSTQQRNVAQLQELDGSVPSWALARIGHILAHESQHF